MSFTSTAYYRNFSVIPEPQTIPVPLDHLAQVPKLLDLGSGSGSLDATQLLAGALYFNPAGGAKTWVLPAGDDMIKTFGKGVNKYMGSGAIVRVEVINYGASNLIIQAGDMGSQSKTFAGGNGTGICNCLNIKFTSDEGAYLVF